MPKRKGELSTSGVRPQKPTYGATAPRGAKRQHMKRKTWSKRESKQADSSQELYAPHPWECQVLPLNIVAIALEHGYTNEEIAATG